MKAVVSRVTSAKVTVAAEICGEIDLGFLVLVGVMNGDNKETAELLWRKIEKLRIFEDESGKTNLDLASVHGSILFVSQFTLCAEARRGNRPSFSLAASPDEAKELFDYLVNLSRAAGIVIATGEFGADMCVEMKNQGPFTILLDTDLM